MQTPVLKQISRDHFGNNTITFALRGNRYAYDVQQPDVLIIKRIYKYSKWKALNYAKRVGQLKCIKKRLITNKELI